MTLAVDLYWSFRSPYSYLATGRLVSLARDHDVDIRVRPVYPLAIRDPGFFKRINPRSPAYLQRDVLRLGEMLGIPLVWPKTDPVVMDMETMTIPEEQPYIHRLTRLGVAAGREGKGLAYIDAVSRRIWGGTEDWYTPENMRAAASEAGLDHDSLLAAVEADPQGFDTEAEDNQASLLAAGHWGVPTMVFQGEPFFGQDRVEALIWRLKQNGLQSRRV